MKIKNLFLSGLACLAMTACSNNDEPGTDPTGQTETTYVRVQIAMVGDVNSRGTDGGTVNGTPAEQKVNNIDFVFYDAAGNYVCDGKTISSDITTTPQGNAGTTGVNVEAITNTVLALELEPGEPRPAQVIAYVNMASHAASFKGKTNNTSISNAMNKIYTAGIDYANVNNSSFIMTNSTYLNDNSVKVGTTLNTNDFYETETAALASTTPVEIYVERMAAKVTAKTDANATINDIKVASKDGVLFARFEIEGYALNGLNTKSYFLKNIPTSDPFSNWNASNLYRSYWAKDVNYESVETEVLDYINYNETGLQDESITNVATEPRTQYCLENTLTSTLWSTHKYKAATHLLIFGRYKIYKANNEGTAAGNETVTYTNNTFYKYAGTLYTEEDMKSQLVAAAGSAANIYTKTTESDKDVYTTIDWDASNYQIVKDANDASLESKVIVQLANNISLTDKYMLNPTFDSNQDESETNSKYISATTDAINVALAANNAEGFKDAAAYFAVPIEHLFSNTTEGYDATGELGIVRNHAYELTITSITKDMGTGIYTFDQDIIPQEPNIKYYVGARLNVLSWKVVKQNVEL